MYDLNLSVSALTHLHTSYKHDKYMYTVKRMGIAKMLCNCEFLMLLFQYYFKICTYLFIDRSKHQVLDKY